MKSKQEQPHVLDGQLESETTLQLVGFRLGDEEFGVDIQKVQEIIRIMQITRVPKSQEYVKGVINLRGKVIPVISLSKRFGHDEKLCDRLSRIVVLDANGKTIGILVDAVSQVIRIAESKIEHPPAMISGIGSKYIKGVGKLNNKLIIVLDVDELLSTDETQVTKKVA